MKKIELRPLGIAAILLLCAVLMGGCNKYGSKKTTGYKVISYKSYMDTACVRWVNEHGFFCLTPCVRYVRDSIK